MCPNSNDNLDGPVQYNISVLNHWKNTQDTCTNTKFSPLFVATSEYYAEALTSNQSCLLCKQ